MPFNELNNPVLKDIEDVYRSNDSNTIPSLSNVKDGLLNATHSYNDPNMSTHKIEDNESMYAIANKLGKHPDDIKEANSLSFNNNFLPGDYINLPIDIMGRPGSYTPPEKNWEEVGDNPWDTDWNEAFRSLENIADINERVRLGELYRNKRADHLNHITQKGFWDQLTYNTPVDLFDSQGMGIDGARQTSVTVGDLPVFKVEEVQRAMYNDGSGAPITPGAWEAAKQKQIDNYNNLPPEDRVFVDHLTGSPINSGYWDSKVHIAFTPSKDFQAQIRRHGHTLTGQGAPYSFDKDSEIALYGKEHPRYLNAYGFYENKPHPYTQHEDNLTPHLRGKPAFLQHTEKLLNHVLGTRMTNFYEYTSETVENMPNVLVLNFDPKEPDPYYSPGSVVTHELFHLPGKQHTPAGQYTYDMGPGGMRIAESYPFGGRKIDSRELGQYLIMAIYDEHMKLPNRTDPITMENLELNIANRLTHLDKTYTQFIGNEQLEELLKDDPIESGIQRTITPSAGGGQEEWQNILWVFQQMKKRPSLLKYYLEMIGMSTKETAYA